MWKPVCNYISGAPAVRVYSINSTTFGVCVTEFDQTHSDLHFTAFPIARLQIWLVWFPPPPHACRNISCDTARLRQVALNTRASQSIWQLGEDAAQQDAQSHTCSGSSPHGHKWTIMRRSNSYSHLEWEYVRFVTYLSFKNTWLNDYRCVTTSKFVLIQ